jgi:hypothetical protein
LVWISTDHSVGEGVQHFHHGSHPSLSMSSDVFYETSARTLRVSEHRPESRSVRFGRGWLRYKGGVIMLRRPRSQAKSKGGKTMRTMRSTRSPPTKSSAIDLIRRCKTRQQKCQRALIWTEMDANAGGRCETTRTSDTEKGWRDKKSRENEGSLPRRGRQ